MRLLYTISLFFGYFLVPLYGILHYSIKDDNTGNYCIILEVAEINGTVSYEDLSGRSQSYSFSVNSISGYTGTCNSSQIIGLVYTATQNSTVLQNDPEEILPSILFWVEFGQKLKKEAPSIMGIFYFNSKYTNETQKTVNYTNIDYTVDWGKQGFSCPSQRWVKDQSYVEFNGLKVVAYANLTNDQIPHDQPFKTCDHIDEDLMNLILLLTVVLILIVLLPLIIACLCMTGVCACFMALMMGFVQWIARSRDEVLIANYD